MGITRSTRQPHDLQSQLRLIIGIAVHDMRIGQALETYSILTVGDGLVSQIPAVIISIASALLLARGGATGSTDIAILDQLGRHPSALATVAVLLTLFALVPGLPFLPFLTGALVLGASAALRESMNIRDQPNYSMFVETTVEKIRDQLGAAAFQAAFDAGRAMSLEEAVTFALDELRR